MGLFGKLFDKKECSICGGEIGLLGNRKLEDGNCCKECAKKLSPWFEERRHSTVEDIKRQLAYRVENKRKVAVFHATKVFETDNYNVYIDEHKGQFAIARELDVETNPDIVNLSQIINCELNIEQDRTEEQYENQEGEMVDYNPPRYKYSYKFSINIGVNSPWFDDMNFDLHSFDIEQHEQRRLMELENLGNQIVSALRGVPYNPQMNGMQGNMYGQQQMQNQTYNAGIFCEMCGWQPEDMNHVPKFCPQCGNPLNKG